MIFFKRQLLLFGLVVLIACDSSAQLLKCGYGEKGLMELSYGKDVLLDIAKGKGNVFLGEYSQLILKDGSLSSTPLYEIRPKYDASANALRAALPWGNVNIQYRQKEDSLYMDIGIENTSTNTVRGFSFSLMTLDLGAIPSNFISGNSYVGNNIDKPALFQARRNNYNLIVESCDYQNKAYVGLMQDGASTRYRLWFGTMPFYNMKDFAERSYANLAPKSKWSLQIAVKFTKSGTGYQNASSSFLRQLRDAEQNRFRWADRRPIGALFLSSYKKAKSGNKNVRNWSFLPEVTELTPGLINKHLKSYADRSIQYLKSVDAQGVIIWDIEGQQFPHPLSYVGDPEIMHEISPEMDKVADAFFASFREKGLRVGICIRPDTVLLSKQGLSRKPVDNPTTTLERKIRYARKRWGCTLFYIDSNLDWMYRPMSWKIFEHLSRTFPDVLLIPEHQNLQYYRVSAPYEEMKQGVRHLDELATEINSTATMVLNLSDGFGKNEAEEEKLRILRGLKKEGVIFLFRAWYPDPVISLIKKIN